jgi:hypothetical protein
MSRPEPLRAAQALFSRIAIASPATVRPKPMLPQVQAARDRDAAARARLQSGHSESEPEPDFATLIRTTELSSHRGRWR